MNFEVYQKYAAKTAIHDKEYEVLFFNLKSDPTNPINYKSLSWVYPSLGLANEVGEVTGKLKKVIRDNGGEITPELKEKLIGELGDVLWYLSETCTQLGINLQEVADNNLEKLKSRQERGTLRGNGDNR